MKNTYDIYDPLAIEIVAIDETFESVFNGLKGVYFRLYYKESNRPINTQNIEKMNFFYKRYREFGRLKRSYRYNDWVLKREAVDIYSKELRKMLKIELNEYATIPRNIE